MTQSKVRKVAFKLTRSSARGASAPPQKVTSWSALVAATGLSESYLRRVLYTDGRMTRKEIAADGTWSWLLIEKV